MSATPVKLNPFPGLRPFTQEEDYLFFGREEQTMELLQRLSGNRFLAVVGTSGSGKSSLVRCGLLSQLLGGKMLEAGASWEIAVTHPGGNPLALLTDSLLETDLYHRETEHARENLLATLSRSQFGLVEAVKQAGLGEGANFLLVVDQFEEIFRFHEAGQWQQEAANEFVSLLLEAVAQKEVPIYVVLTMRSDFIGECGQFEGLAEMVNRGEFLIPRLTRQQYKRVIEGPIKVAGGQIEPRLLQRLLNDLGQQADQLPCLQHALMRTWTVWTQRNDTEALDLHDYQLVGKMSQALSLHADEIYQSLANDRQRALCKGIFQALTVEESNSRGIRRPQRLGRLCQILEVSSDELAPIIDAYRQSGVTFLTPSPRVDLADQTIIDISHESLMRVWTQLRQWVEEETQAAGIYHRLSESAALHEQGKAGLYRDPELGIALAWREAKRPNAAWAERYRPGFATALAFLEASQQASVAEEHAREASRKRELEQAQQLSEAQELRLGQQQRAARKLRRMIAGLAMVAVIAGLACVAALFANQRANTQADIARRNEEKANLSTLQAVQSQQEAEQARSAAQAETYHAVISEVRALRAGHESGWREKALGDLARLAVMPTPRRDLPELRTEAAATLGAADIRLVARVALPDAPASINFSPDGKTLLTADPNTGLDFWDVSRTSHLSSIVDLAVAHAVYLPDGQGLAVACRDRGVVFLDKQGANTKRAPITQGSNQPTKLAISANGQRIAVTWSGDAGTTVHNAANGILVARFKDSNPTFALSPDGKWLARQENGDIVLLPISSGEPRVVLGRYDGAHALAFSQNGAMLAAAFADHTTVLWNVSRREQFGTLRGHREQVFDVAFSPDGEWIATGSLDYTTRIWETRTGQNVAVLPGFSSPTNGVKWSPTGDILAVTLNNSREVLLYKVTGRNRVQQWLVGHGVELATVVAHPRLERLATSGYTELNTWDLSVPRPSAMAIGPNPGPVTSLAYSPDGSLLAIGSGHIFIRDADTGKVRMDISGPNPIITALAFDPEGKRLASGDQVGNVILWDAATGVPVQKLVTGSTVWSILILDRSQYMVTHSRDAILLFNLESGKLERKVDLPGGIRKFVSDRERRRLVVGFESGALCSLSLPDLTLGPRIEKAHDGSVAYLALSPDGRLLASGSDHRVFLRDAVSFETLLRFPVWDGTLRNMTFDAKGRRLAIVGTGNDVDLWDIDALRNGLADVGLAWDRPAPATVPAIGLTDQDGQLRAAVPVMRRPGTIDPAVLEEVNRLVQSGVGAFESGRQTEAIRDLLQARDRLRTLHQAAPANRDVASQFAISLGFLGSALRKENRLAEALVALKESRQVLEAIRQPSFVDIYNLACTYSNLITLFEPGSAPPTAAERAALEEQAMEALRRAIAAGMTDFALMERDSDLDPLRNRPDFHALFLESSGRTREAIPHLAKASAAKQKDTILALKLAVLQAWFKLDKDLVTTRQRILSFAKDASDAGTAERAARACSILPSADKAELEAALALGRTAVKFNKAGMWNLLALGMAEYRSGNDVAAEKSLLAAVQAGPDNPHVTGISAYYRAMSLFRQGKKDEARKLAVATTAKMKPLPKDENNPLAGNASIDDLILWMAYKEAKAMIKFEPASAAP